MRKVILGDLSFDVEVIRNDRRKFSVEVIGRRSIKVSAPPEAEWTDIRERILNKETWILRRDSYFQDLPLILPERRIETGEAFYLLGEQYRITVTNGDNLVEIQGYNIFVMVDDLTEARQLFIDWLTDYVSNYLEKLFSTCLETFQYKLDLSVTPRLRIKRMKRRWGSCSSNNLITLNSDLISAHPKCIEYVIFHELCHTIHLDHSDDFYRTLRELVPNHTDQKHVLETTTQLTEGIAL